MEGASLRGWIHSKYTKMPLAHGAILTGTDSTAATNYNALRSFTYFGIRWSFIRRWCKRCRIHRGSIVAKNSSKCLRRMWLVYLPTKYLRHPGDLHRRFSLSDLNILFEGITLRLFCKWKWRVHMWLVSLSRWYCVHFGIAHCSFSVVDGHVFESAFMVSLRVRTCKRSAGSSRM